MPVVDVVPPRAWPLTGRHGDLDSAQSAFADPQCRALLLTGDPGVGKTRLARALLRRLAAEGRAVAWATATPSARTVPLGAVAHLLPGLADTAPVHVLALAREAVATAGDGRGVVLGVDDVHLLDPTTTAVLAPLLDSAAVTLVATLPDGADAPDVVTSLWRSGRATALRLEPLDALAVDALLHRALGAPVDGGAVASLLAASGGNALFLRELVMGSLTRGSLVEVDGVWRLRGDPAPSGLLRSLVAARVDSLGPAVRRVLEEVAVAEVVGLADLLAGHDPVDVEAAERAGLLRVDESGRRRDVRVAHGLHADVLVESLGRVARARLSRAVAERLESYGARRAEDAARVARLRLDADGTAPPAVLLRAAEIARVARDLDTVERLTRAALVGARPADPVAARMLAEVLYERGAFDEAERVLERPLADGAPALDPAGAAVLAVARATVIGYGAGRLGDAVALLADAEESAPTVERVVLRARRAAHETWRRGPRVALDVLGEAPPPGAEARAVAADRAARAPALALAGRSAEALDLVGPQRLEEVPGTPEIAAVLALTEAGDLAGARERADRGYAAVAAARLPLVQLWFAHALGRLALLEGRPVTAERWFREQVALCSELQQRLPHALGLSGLATAAVWAGAAVGRLPDLDAPSLLPAEAARGTAWSLVAGGDLAGARSMLERVEQRCADGGWVGQAATAAHERVRLGRADAALVERLAAYAATGDSALVAAWAAHAAGLVAGSADALAAAAERLAELGALLDAAEAMAAAAEASARAGDPRRATALAARAASWSQRCEGARTPGLALAAPEAGAGALTVREREIALLVAQGRSSREIAEALVLSVRTVDNHLQRVFGKLGISSRADVAAALRLRGEAGA